jgi:hypothetical protein
MRRSVRRAEKVFRRWKIEPGRKEWKPKWVRWATHRRLTAEAQAVSPIIEAAESAPYAAIAKLRAPRRKRGMPRKSTE